MHKVTETEKKIIINFKFHPVHSPTLAASFHILLGAFKLNQIILFHFFFSPLILFAGPIQILRCEHFAYWRR